jgi:hypothetical protein
MHVYYINCLKGGCDMSNNLFEDFNLEEKINTSNSKYLKKVQEKLQEEAKNNDYEYDGSYVVSGITNVGEGVNWLGSKLGLISDQSYESTDAMLNIVTILNRKVGDNVIDEVIDTEFGDKEGDLLHNILSNEEITNKLDLSTLILITSEASKIKGLDPSVQQFIDFIKENQVPLAETYVFLEENGLNSTELASLADTFMQTEGSNATKFTATLKQLFENENFTKNINKDFFKDLFSIAGDMNISEEYNTYIDAIKDNDVAIDKFAELFKDNNIDKDSIIDSFLNFANDELKDGKIDFSNLGKYILKEDNIANFIEKYKQNYEDLSKSQGNDITNKEFDDNKNNLSNKEMLLLSSMSYSHTLFTADNVGKNLKDIFLKYDKDGDGRIDKTEAKKIDKPGWFKNNQMSEMINEILQNDKLANLKLSDTADISENYLVASTFEDSSGNATVIFEGTDDATQWSDNFDGLLVDGSDIHNTNVQQAAKNYIEQVCAEKNYNGVSVAGHSKGANLAQCVTVLCPDLVKSCVAFDGQGFTNEWIEENKDAIEKVKNKISAVNAYIDPISSMLNPIAGTTTYVDCYSETGWPTSAKDIKNFFIDAHCPYGIYKANKTKWQEKDKADVATFVGNLSSTIESVSFEGKQIIDNTLSETLDDVHCEDSTIGDKDSLEIKGTEITVDNFKVIKTDKGYNVYENGNDNVILAQLDSNFNKVSGTLEHKLDNKTEDYYFSKFKEKYNDFPYDGITNMPKYINGIMENFAKFDCEKLKEAYPLKDIKLALEHSNLDSEIFNKYCESVSNNKEQIIETIQDFVLYYKNTNLNKFNGETFEELKKSFNDFFEENYKIYNEYETKMNSEFNKTLDSLLSEYDDKDLEANDLHKSLKGIINDYKEELKE